MLYLSPEDPLKEPYSLRIYKQYFNFSASHFLVFPDGTRESLHGHNYRVQVQAQAHQLQADMVFDFLDIKPIVRQVCDSLDHLLLLPRDNPHLQISLQGSNYHLQTADGDQFSIPKKDALLLPLSNTSAERLAMYIAQRIKDTIAQKYHFAFSKLEIEVEETPGQSASFHLEGGNL